MKRKLALFFLVILLPCHSYSATGDVLWQCNFESTGATANSVVTACGGGASGATSSFASIKTSGGHNGGKYINFYYNNTGELYDPFMINSATIRKSDLTIVYYEKYDTPLSAVPYWNVKSMRIYFEGGGYFGPVSRENDGWWEQTTVPNRPITMNVSKAVTHVRTDTYPNFCTAVSGGTSTCPQGRITLKSDPNLNDTSWHKVRYYFKAPSSGTATDGVIMHWIDDTLIYSVTNASASSSTVTGLIGEIRFHPSDDLLGTIKTTFNHSYDDITIYEGYVPPISAPTGVKGTVIK